MEVLLFPLTLGVGWLVWSLVLYSRAQTPAKQLLGLRVFRRSTASPATWVRMALRELVAKPLGSLVCGLTVGVLYFMLLWDANTQEVWDKLADTVVVDDRRR